MIDREAEESQRPTWCRLEQPFGWEMTRANLQESRHFQQPERYTTGPAQRGPLRATNLPGAGVWGDVKKGSMAEVPPRRSDAHPRGFVPSKGPPLAHYFAPPTPGHGGLGGIYNIGIQPAPPKHSPGGASSPSSRSSGTSGDNRVTYSPPPSARSLNLSKPRLGATRLVDSGVQTSGPADSTGGSPASSRIEFSAQARQTAWSPEPVRHQQSSHSSSLSSASTHEPPPSSPQHPPPALLGDPRNQTWWNRTSERAPRLQPPTLQAVSQGGQALGGAMVSRGGLVASRSRLVLGSQPVLLGSQTVLLTPKAAAAQDGQRSRGVLKGLGDIKRTMLTPGKSNSLS